MIRLADAPIILTDRELPDEIAACAEELKAKIIGLNELAEGGDTRDFDAGSVVTSDTAIILFTSGSTRIPKGVLLTHDNFINTVFNVVVVPQMGGSTIESLTGARIFMAAKMADFMRAL